MINKIRRAIKRIIPNQLNLFAAAVGVTPRAASLVIASPWPRIGGPSVAEFAPLPKHYSNPAWEQGVYGVFEREPLLRLAGRFQRHPARKYRKTI